VLFLGSVVVPCLVLLVLGVRTIRQDEELAEKREEEERSRAVALARRELLTRLETIKLRASGGQVSPRDAEVALIADVRSGRLVLPWERSDEGSARAQADLRTAAALLRQGNRREALTISHRLLPLPGTITDEYGIPIAIYAARALSSSQSPDVQPEIARLAGGMLEVAWLSPAALYMIADLPRMGEDLRKAARARAVELEKAENLTAELPVLERAGPRNGDDPFWLLVGNAPWLVSLAGQPKDRERTLVAVRARNVLDLVKLPGRSRWVLGKDPEGEPLGENFPGIRIGIDTAPDGSRPRARGWFSLAALILLSVTAFSAWLLNRDVRREARLASLRSQFVSSVSHELKTPIATIRAYAELIEMGRVEGTTQTSEYMKTILAESERLSRLVEGVLEFSKLEQGKRLYHFDSVSLEDVVGSAAQALAYSLECGGFQLHLDVEADLPPVNADRDALEQAVVNLLSNAMKYSGDGRDIDLSLRREDREAVIRVRDRGIGIAPEEQSRIFESFYRAPLADGAHVPGTGLGLTLVDHIVTAHRGRVAVESQSGQGSTFSILLPLEPGQV
jgi:signal transduction histidine kinase